MTTALEPPQTLADVLAVVDMAKLTAGRRDLVSAIRRICQMTGTTPEAVAADPPRLRQVLGQIRPAAHGISAKSWSTMRSAFTAALELASVVDNMGRGRALRDAAWAPLMRPIAHDKRLSNGLAGFANWCAGQGLPPDAVTDEAVQRFNAWIETRTLHPRSRDIVRGVPQLWNEAAAHYQIWPQIKLARLSFRPPRQRLAWAALSESWRFDAEAYLALRAEPDIFDEAPNAPRRPLAASTLRQHREHLRLSASILVESGVKLAEIASLADLVTPERFKIVLRYYHARANGEPCAFAVCLAKTLIDVARYHVGVSPEALAELKYLAGKLPPIPFDLTEKNKKLLRQLESEQVRARLLFLPEELLAEVAKALEAGIVHFVLAEVAIAIDIQLCIPLRPQNLISLIWGRHFLEPDGSKGRLLLHIPASETKTKQKDVTIEIADDVAKRLRWFKRHILPRLNADTNGPLFVTGKGSAKGQETLTHQMINTIAERVGIHMTPHQFRHFAAVSYLEAQPEDFQTVQVLLGHSWAKTTQIYAGLSGRRAGRAYGSYLLKQREALKLKRASRKKRTRAKRSDENGGPRPCAS